MPLKPFHIIPESLRDWAEWCRNTTVTPGAETVTESMIADNAVSNRVLRDSAPNSVIGNPTGSSANPSDISAGADNTVLTRRSGALQFLALVDADIPATIARDIEVTAAIAAHEADPDPHPGLPPYYEQTDAESTATITPTDYSYAPGDVRRYGVVYDSAGAASANATILNALGTASWSITLTFTDGDVFFDDQITFSEVNLEFYPAAKLRYNGTADQPAVIFEGGATYTVENFQLDNETAHDWSDEDFVGLRIINTRGQRLHIKRLEGFSINFQAWGSSTSGIGYNRIHILRSFDAKYHVDIHSAVSNGWINENEWYLTGQDNTGSYPTDEDSYGVRFKAESGAYEGMNSNVFHKPSFELEDGDGTVERVAVWFDNAGIRNEFEQCRIEQGTKVLKVSSDAYAATYNTVDVLTLIGSNFTGGSDPDELVENTDGGLGFANIVRTRRFGSDRPAIWHSSDLVEKSFPTSAARAQTEGFFYEHGTDDAGVERYDGQGRILHRWLRLSGTQLGIGVYVDTTSHKELEVIIGSHADRGANVVVVCYDEDGAVLTSSDTGYPHVAADSLTESASLWGYSYRTTSGTLGKFTFRVSSNVAKIKLIVAGDGSTAGAYIRSFSIFGYHASVRPYAMRVWGGFPTAQRLVDDSPATIRNGGYSLRGTVAYNDDAASGAVSYWQCTASGWNATAWVATTAYVLDQMVENDTGKIYVCRAAGTSAGAGGPTGTSTGITDDTVTWDYLGTLATWTAGPSNP